MSKKYKLFKENAIYFEHIFVSIPFHSWISFTKIFIYSFDIFFHRYLFWFFIYYFTNYLITRIMHEYREKNNNLRNPDIRKHVYKQYTLAIHRRAGGSARRGWGRERVSRVADLFALSPFPRFMDLAGHAADLWPVRIHNRLSPNTRI